MEKKTRLGRLLGVLLLLIGVGLPACGGSTTTFTSSWRSPTAEPLAMRGEKVVAVVMMQNEGTRRNAENVLAREITHYGAKGIAMHTLMPAPALGNEAAARAAIERAQVKGILVMRPISKKKKVETRRVYTGAEYGTYWGGYYGYGWGTPYGSDAALSPAAAWGPSTSSRGALVAGPPHAPPPGSSQSSVETHTTDTDVVEVEVLFYSLKQNRLVWAGQSETTDPEKVDEFVTQLAAQTVKELGGQGLLSSD